MPVVYIIYKRLNHHSRHYPEVANKVSVVYWWCHFVGNTMLNSGADTMYIVELYKWRDKQEIVTYYGDLVVVCHILYQTETDFTAFKRIPRCLPKLCYCFPEIFLKIESVSTFCWHIMSIDVTLYLGCLWWTCESYQQIGQSGAFQS